MVRGDGNERNQDRQWLGEGQGFLRVPAAGFGQEGGRYLRETMGDECRYRRSQGEGVNLGGDGWRSHHGGRITGVVVSGTDPGETMTLELTDTLSKRLQIVWPWIIHASTTYGVDPFLIAAIAWKESDFNHQAVRFEENYYQKYCRKLSATRIKKLNPAATSTAAERRLLAMAWGPMQIVGLTARERGYHKPHLASLCGEDGVRMGVTYLVYQLGRHAGDVEKAVSAYNAGSVIQSNQKTYVEPVMERLRILRAELHDNPALGEEEK